MNKIVSPCIQTCMIDRTSKLCTGCFRSMDEIREWSILTPHARDAIMLELPNRKPT